MDSGNRNGVYGWFCLVRFIMYHHHDGLGIWLNREVRLCGGKKAFQWNGEKPMIVKRNLYEIYQEIERLKEEQSIQANLAVSCLAEGDEAGALRFSTRFQYYTDRIEGLAEIEVEYDDPYVAE